MNRAQRDVLITAHLKLVPLVARTVRRSLPPSHSFEDLCGMGAVALVNAAEQYDPGRSRGSSATYFSHKIRFGIFDQLREIEHTRRVGPRPVLVRLPPLHDRFRDEKQRLEGAAIASVDVPRLMEPLPERWREPLRLYTTVQKSGDMKGFISQCAKFLPEG